MATKAKSKTGAKRKSKVLSRKAPAARNARVPKKTARSRKNIGD